MQLSRMLATSLVFATTAVATIVSCSDTSRGAVDGSVTIDTSGTVNALGQLCPIAIGGGGSDCPDGNSCKAINGIGTNTSTGYCTPNCMGSDSVCSTGYMGPPGGIERCSLGSSSTNLTGCAIECTSPAQCPTGLTCVMANATTKLCVPS